MKTTLFLIVGFCSTSFFHAQDSLKEDTSKAKVIGFSPSKNVDNVNGILFKYFDEEGGNFKPKKVNGLGMGLNPLGIFLPALILFSLPDAGKWDFNNDYVIPENQMNKINGIQLSIMNMEPTVTNGLEINVSSNINTYAVINGVSFSTLFNIHHEMKGVSVAPFANFGKKCRGLQIGAFNKCDDFKGIQIGWWNENEKRKLPLINWNFKAKKQ